MKLNKNTIIQSDWITASDTEADKEAINKIREEYMRRSAAKKAHADANKGGRHDHRCKSNKTRRTRKCKCNTRRRMRR